MTKEEAVRDELKFGKEAGMFNDLRRAYPGRFDPTRGEEIVAGGPMTETEVDELFDMLELDDDVLSDD